MKQYKIQTTEKALSDMEEIYNYIAELQQAPEAAMGQYNRIADVIETIDKFPERVKLRRQKKNVRLDSGGGNLSRKVVNGRKIRSNSLLSFCYIVLTISMIHK